MAAGTILLGPEAGGRLESWGLPPSPLPRARLRGCFGANGGFYSCIPIPAASLGLPAAFGCFGPKKKEEKCLRGGTGVLNGAGGGGREPRQQTRLGLLSSQLGNKFTDTGNNFFPDSANSLTTLTRRAPQGGELELCKKLSAEALFKATWGMLKY